MAFAQQQDIDISPHLPFAAPPPDVRTNGFVQTRERVIHVGGVAYRQIQYNGEIFTIRANQPEAIVNCDNVNLPPNTYAVQGEMQIAKRTELFVQTLRQHCSPLNQQISTQRNAHDTNLGVQFKGENPGDSDKRIFVNPINKTGGAGITF